MTISGISSRAAALLFCSRRSSLATALFLAVALALTGCGGGSLVGEFQHNAPPSGGPGATIGGGAASVPPPTISNVAPSTGDSSGGTAITITGAAFQAGAIVLVGGKPATNVVVTNATSIQALTAPNAPGTYEVQVINPDDQSGARLASFTYLAAPAPTLIQVLPNSGPSSGGTVVNLSGSNYQSGAAVLFGGAAATNVTLISAAQLQVTTPSVPAGIVDVQVINPDSQSVTLTGGFTFTVGPAPTIVSVSPGAGPSIGGTAVTITGTNFAPGAIVQFGNVTASNVIVNSATQITVITPPHATGVTDVIVRNPDNQSATRASAFNFVPPPSITSVSPTNGPLAGGIVVTITGSAFQGGAAVSFGGTPAASVTIQSSTQLLATTPAHAPGTVDVVVTNFDGQSGTLTGGFTFNLGPAPSITGVAPASGPIAGGTSVVITGANFQTGVAVDFGASAAASVTLNITMQTITAVTPASSAGVVDVNVMNTDGQVGTLANGFTFIPPPTVSSVSPPSGAASGGTLVTITGTDFLANATVTFGGTASPNVTVVSATTVQAVTPAHAVGAVNVVVSNPDTQTDTLTNGYTFNAPPTVTSVSPNSGPLAGGTSVTVAGTNFRAGAVVLFDGFPATGVVVNSATSITAVTPADSAGPANVDVINTDGTQDTLVGGFTYNPAPTVTSVSPASGPTGGGTVVLISGTGFLTGATVTFGAIAATSVTVSSTTSILATSPAGGAGAVNVNVRNTDNQTSPLAGVFTYTAAPVVTSVTPSFGPTAGGTTVTITGSNFVVGATVTFGLNAATGVVVNSANSITAVTPAGAAGSVTVTVTNIPSLQFGSLPLGFSYTPPAPTVGSVNPTSGAATGGTLVTITGTNFVANATVSFGGTASPNVTIVSATSIQAVTPAHAAGAAVDVVVTNPNALFGTLPSGYTFNAAPTVTIVSPNNGPLAGGTSVTITGTNFMAAPTVRFGANFASGVAFNSATSITAVSPAGAAGSVSVTVLNTDGQQVIQAGAFTYIPAPTVTSISPNSGPAGGGTAVLITGTGFRAGATVTIGGTAATSVVVASATSITAVTSVHAAGTVNVVVTNPDLQSATPFSGYTFNSAPAVSSVVPNSGPTSGGTTVTITGSNFFAGATVTFGLNAATGVVVNSATSITAVTPAGAAASVTVTVTNIPSLQFGSLPLGFSYTPPPTVSSVAPVSGPAGGGTTILINGSDFVVGAAVLVGGAAGTNVVVTSAASITADTPTHGVGTFAVQVRNPDGQVSSSTISTSNSFTFDAAPTISSVSPSSGPTAGGTAITITGTGFDVPGAAVSIGGISASSVIVVSATSITAVTPAAGSAGAASVTVLNPDGQTALLTGGFSYSTPAPPPTVTSVLPINGSQNGGTTVTITGTGFQFGATVLFGTNAATGVVVNSATSITAVTPAGTPGPVTVKVTNLDAQFGLLPSAFAYLVSSVAVVTSDLPDGNLQVPYTIGFAGFGGVLPYTWTQSSGSLPPGLALNANTGFLDGVPTQTGSFSFTILVSDKATPSAQTATANFTLAIVAIPTGPNLPQFPQVFIDTSMPVQTGTVRNVTACSQLQTTINAAQLGDTIVIDSSLTCVGQFTLPAKTTGTGWIIIRSSAMASLPPEGTRIKPAVHAPFMPKILSNVVSGEAMRVALRAHHYRLIGLEIGLTAATGSSGPLLNFDPLATAISDYPNFLIADRLYIHGNPTRDARRGVGVGGGSIAVIDSYISDIHAVGQDTQAIGGWNFPGPLKIVNNYLEGAGENIILGGAGPVNAGVVPSDIEIRRNYFFKPLSWRVGDPSYAGIHWSVKNSFEIKDGQRILFEGNLLEHNWADAQNGFMVLFTPRVQAGNVPQAVAQDTTFRYNILRSAGSGINVLGRDDTFLPQPDQANRIWIHNNLMEDVSSANWGGTGRMFQALHGVVDLRIDHNTGFENNYLAFADPSAGAKQVRFIFQDNIFPKANFGVLGSGTSQGNPTLNFYFPGFTFLKNAIQGANPAIYPANNFFPPLISDIQFVNYNGGLFGDYRLLPSSPLKNAGSNGKDVGARAGAVVSAVTGVP